MSAFKDKIKQLKDKTVVRPTQDFKATFHKSNLRHVCSATQIGITACSKSPRSDLLLREPVIITKKNERKGPVESQYGLERKKIKKAQLFVPIEIPKSPPSGSSSHRVNLDKLCNTQSSTPCLNKQIEIHIDKDDTNNKACLKKLFKKIHKLSQELSESEKERIRLQLELNNLKEVDGYNRGQQKDLMKQESENYKLKVQVEMLKNQLRDKAKQISDIRNKVPTQIIKEIVVEKPVEVKVEVPRYIPGPEKIVEVVKHVESEADKEELVKLKRKVSYLEEQLERERKQTRRVSEMNVPEIVEKPVYLEKPVYVDRPIYVDRPYEVTKQKIIEKPIYIPYQVPVYIDKPVIDDEMIKKMGELEQDVECLIRENEQLKLENERLKNMLSTLYINLETLKRHNFSKNHEMESLLHNLEDYNPIKIRQTVQRSTRQVHRDHRFHRHELDTFNPHR